MWPKLLPLQEKMVSSTNPLMQISPPSTQLGQGQKVGIYEQISNLNLDNFLESSVLGNLNNGRNLLDSNIVPRLDGMEQSNEGIQTFQGEIDVGFQPVQEDSIAEFDCFKEIDGSKGNLIWWSNDELDSKSVSSNSWDSTSLLRSKVMYDDYVQGYSLEC